MIGRYLFSIVVGVIVTLSLLFVMNILIVTGKQALTKPRDRAQLEFVRVKRNESLNVEDYTPEKAGEICGIHPENIHKLARKVATRKTKIFIGWNSGKYYHGDLMERSMALLLGLVA